MGKREEVHRVIRVHEWADEARRLNKRNAAQLEIKLEHDEHNEKARVQLTAYYFDQSFSDKYVLPSLAKHITWFVNNEPTHPILETPYGSGTSFPSNHVSYKTLKTVWDTVIASNFEDAKVLFSASNFFLLRDKSRAIELLERCVTLEPQEKNYLERLAFANELASKKGEISEATKRAHQLRERLVEEFGADDRQDDDLANLCEAAYANGDHKKALKAAQEVLSLNNAEEISPDSLHKVHTILGHLALDRGDLESAIRELLASADVESSPVLCSFGPKFTLAARLLKKGKRNAVADYLTSCSRFWESGQKDLTYWMFVLSVGGQPSLKKSGAVELLIPRWMNHPTAYFWKLLRLKRKN